MIVLDSGAALTYLVGGDAAEWVESLLEAERAHAPHLVDVEVASGLRNLVLRRRLKPSRAERALVDFAALRLTRYPHLALLSRAWALRANVTAYDAVYVALAEGLDCPLVTTDVRVARAPGVRARVLVPPV